MIKTERLMINGTEYMRTYSDAGKKIERDGVLYDEAIDPIGSGRVYEESAEPTEDGEEITDAEALDIILGGVE